MRHLSYIHGMRVFIETGRLLLRELLPEDEAGIFELDSDPEVHRYLGQKPIRSTEEAGQVIQFVRHQYKEFGIGRWAVIEKETGAFAGWSGLKFITDTINGHSGFYDLGYRFIKKFWGKGYATETAKATVQYAFETLGLNELYGMAHAENIASQQVLGKAGLQYVNAFELEGLPQRWYRWQAPPFISTDKV